MSMKLFQLNVGDEFKLTEKGCTYKLLPSEDQEFLATGNLRVQNQTSDLKEFFHEQIDVTLVNHNG